MELPLGLSTARRSLRRIRKTAVRTARVLEVIEMSKVSIF